MPSAVASVAAMTVGNLGALRERSLRRLLVATAIAHVGYGSDNPAGTRGAISDAPQGKMVPAVLKYDAMRPRLLTVAQIVDCLSGGIIVTTDKPATGG